MLILLPPGEEFTALTSMDEQPLTQRELSLIYFDTFEKWILEYLSIVQDPAMLTDDDKVGLADGYLWAMAE